MSLDLDAAQWACKRAGCVLEARRQQHDPQRFFYVARHVATGVSKAMSGTLIGLVNVLNAQAAPKEAS